jgi:phage terminase large subunit-like protein
VLKDEEKKRFLHYTPYGKQLEFHNSQADERILSGGNQCGKTIAGCMEMSFHATGVYPSWWEGHRIEPRVNASSGEKEINLWVIGTDSKTVRDSLQSKIIGTEAKDFTDGCLHRDLIDGDRVIKARGVTGLVDTVYVRHKSGCMSKIQFRSYEQGRENLQSATVDACYCDEEPPTEVLGEIRARLGATGGFLFIAFTPLNGMTPLVQEFWSRDNPDKFLTCLSVYDSPHYTPDKLRKLEGKYSGLSEAERQARMNGIPTMGSGVVYPIDDHELYWDTIGEIPEHWERIGGPDFGRGDHPTALVWVARDPVTDIAYVYDAVKTTRNSIEQNAAIMRKRGEWIPFSYPHDLMRDSGISVSTDKLKTTEGYRYKQMYEDNGITFTPHNAKTEEGSTRVEVGICEIRQRMLTGRLKVAKHLSEWFKEKQVYRYQEDGKPTKEKDDLLDATRYAIIMLRYAKSFRDYAFEIGYNSKQMVVDNTDVY